MHPAVAHEAPPRFDPPGSRREDRPDPADVARWCREFAETRDPDVRRTIAERHGWLVQVCARQMHRRAEPLDDLVQVASIGLLHAIDRFRPEFGVEFRTFASATMLGELRRHYRGTWRVRVPRRLQELHLAVNGAADRLTAELGRSVTPADIAGHLHTSVGEVIEAMAIGVEVRSMAVDADDPAGRGMDPGGPDGELDLADLRTDLRSMLTCLPPLEQRVVYLRFFSDLTQTEIGASLGLSQVLVSRTLRRALARLRLRADLHLDPGGRPGASAGATVGAVA